MNCAAIPEACSRASSSATSAARYRRHRDKPRPVRGGKPRHVVARRDRRHAARGCRRSCSASWKQERCGAVGSDAPRTTDVPASWRRRTANCPLRCAAGRFRQDLFFRLNVVPIAIPALRERREDIPILLEHFLAKSRGRFPRTPAMTFGADALKVLVDYAWPGNVRQLETWLIGA